MLSQEIIANLAHHVKEGLIGLWEGYVTEIDEKHQLIYVNLTPLYGADTEIAGAIPLKKINSAERAFIQLGSLFTLAQYSLKSRHKKTQSTRIEFCKEVWTAEMIAEVKIKAHELFKNLKTE